MKKTKKKKNKQQLPSAIAHMKSTQEVHNYYQKIISCMPNNVYWLDKNCITQGCNDVLNSLIIQEIPTEKAAIEAAYAKKDWVEIERLAHKMKGGAACTGLINMKYACQYLERYLKAGHSKLAEKLYLQLLSVFDKTEDTIKKWMKIARN
ncbi:MAG: Hpt domain-containing protein [Legionellaceae bacterium]|nr:Hpt domain-containing protein [Legionellaceae bacterium]